MKSVLRLPNWIGDAILALPAVELWARPRGGDGILAGRDLPLQLARRVAPQAALLRVAAHTRWGGEFLADVRKLRAAAPAQGLLLTPSFSSALWLRLGRVRERCGWAEQGRGFLLTERIPRAAGAHLVEQFYALARATPDDRSARRAPDAQADGDRAGAGAHGWRERAPDPLLPPDDRAASTAARWLAARPGPAVDSTRRPFVALCPGARYGPAKQWPAERFVALARELAASGLGGVVVGTTDEQPLGAEICAATGTAQSGPAMWQNACGEGSLLVAAELLRRADLAVCNDSGAMHLAAAVGTPVVALFGPTDPAWTGPRGPCHQILRQPYPCAPCLRRSCPYGEPAPCMGAITVAEVHRAIVSTCGGGAAARCATQPAIFLDRDGTLIEPEPYLSDPRRVRLTRGSAAALRAAQAAGYLLVLVTNQSGIARGIFGEASLAAVHAALREQLAAVGVALTGIYVCPHHPQFSGPCRCRKPAPGLLQDAIRELAIDASRSVMIGDTIEDLQAARAAGVAAILVRSGYGAEQARSRVAELPGDARIAEDLAAAIALIL